ncbi:hypothetical protein LCGC14_2143460, partial [marine sediment metagenome]
MTTFMYPPPDDRPWPTLGPFVCDFIESNLCYGPGDLLGHPVTLSDELRAWIFRIYEIEPPYVVTGTGRGRRRRKNPRAGRRRFQRCVLSLRKGSCKALALDTPLPTPTGWTTIGIIRPGDWVFDEMGNPCRVLAASEVFTGNQCFAVKFRDGSEIVADAGHRWYTEELRHRPYQGSVKTTADLAATVSLRADGARNHRIPLTRPLRMPEVELPIDPWVLGMWLGDGRTDDAEFTMAAADFEHFYGRIMEVEYHSGEPKIDSRSGAYAVRVSTAPIRKGGNPQRDTLIGRLRGLGVLNNKHVPPIYLRASVGQRLALLQGLMDSDGCIGSAGVGVSFISTIPALSDAVYELAASLGFKPSSRYRETSLRGAKKPTKPAWMVYFHASADIPVFTLPRKVSRQRPAPTGRTPMSARRHIVAVDEVESVPTRCIAVDSRSHLFLAGRAMTPTHNTEIAAWLAAVELHPDGPVRCAGFDRDQPIPRPVTD